MIWLSCWRFFSIKGDFSKGSILLGGAKYKCASTLRFCVKPSRHVRSRSFLTAVCPFMMLSSHAFVHTLNGIHRRPVGQLLHIGEWAAHHPFQLRRSLCDLRRPLVFFLSVHKFQALNHNTSTPVISSMQPRLHHVERTAARETDSAYSRLLYEQNGLESELLRMIL